MASLEKNIAVLMHQYPNLKFRQKKIINLRVNPNLINALRVSTKEQINNDSNKLIDHIHSSEQTL